jgi:lysophospholipase L1-like esterase
MPSCVVWHKLPHWWIRIFERMPGRLRVAEPATRNRADRNVPKLRNVTGNSTGSLRLRSVKVAVSVCLLLVISAAALSARPITVYLAGDSTMAEKLPNKRPETGWGEALQQYFTDQVRIDNRARNGRSTRTFISEGLWQAIVDSLQAGDYVFIQFGHNDQSKDKPDRYTPPDDFRRNLVRFVSDVRGKRGTPVLFTPVRRRRFDKDGKLYDTQGEYAQIARDVAAAERMPLIDMHEESARVLSAFGAEPSRQLFLQLQPWENPNYRDGVEDNTHFSPGGAGVMAYIAVHALREAKLDLVRHLKLQ